MFTMGGDFHYQAAHNYFKNMDKIIEHMNEMTNETGIHVLYSTPSCYTKALNIDGDGTGVLAWQTKVDDFFPYCDEGGEMRMSLCFLQAALKSVDFFFFVGPSNYWTGYFTSRPSFKYHERQSNALLQSAKQVNALTGDDRQEEGVFPLAEAMGISQHHDAVTGTAKTAVDDDYNVKLA